MHLRRPLPPRLQPERQETQLRELAERVRHRGVVLPIEEIQAALEPQDPAQQALLQRMGQTSNIAKNLGAAGASFRDAGT